MKEGEAKRRTPCFSTGDLHILAYVSLQAHVTEPLGFFREVAEAIAAAPAAGKRIRAPKSFAEVRDFDLWLEPVRDCYRLVFLLDEFEVLAQSERFDLDWWQRRACLSGSAGLPRAFFRS